MTTRPGYVWDKSASEWVSIGPVALPGSKISYQASAPTSPATGDIWVDADDEVPGITSSLNYRWRKIATGGETSLSGVDSSGLPLAYNPGYEQVYLNGVLLYRGSDYVATTGNTITGLTALVANDTIEVLSFVTAPIGDTYTQAAADAKFVNKAVGGLTLVVPTSVTGGTLNPNGAITIGSGVSSVTVNGAFSATYDNYKIIISSGGTVGNDYGSLRLGASTSTYNYAAQTLQYSTAAFGGFGVGTNASEFRYVWSNADGTGYVGNIELQNPFLAQYTRLTSDYATDQYRFFMGGVHKTATSYSSFTVGPNAFTGTLTGGTIRIYGYNNGA